MNRVWIVTESASGLGRSIAEAEMNAIGRPFGVHSPLHESWSYNHD
jgi:hypothetical protein